MASWDAQTGLVAWADVRGRVQRVGSKSVRFSMSQGIDKTDGPLRRTRLVSPWEGDGVHITVQLGIRLYLWFSRKKLILKQAVFIIIFIEMDSK